MKDIISACLPLSESEYQAFEAIARRKEVPKQFPLIQPDRRVDRLFFLDSGAVRAFRYVEGVDYTHYFFTERWFVSDFHSYLTGKSGSLYIVTLNETVYYEFYKQDLEDLTSRYPNFEKLWRIIAEKAFLFTVNRLENLQTKTLRQRYLHLLERDPELFLSFPQKHIASYLGVTEQSLSRIKNQSS